MRIIGRTLKFLVRSTLYSLILFFLYSSVPSARAQSEFSITAFPAVIDQQVVAGESSRFLIQFKNNTSDFVSGKVRVGNYVINDKTGSPMLINDPLLKVKYAAASWITPSQEDITIPPNNYVPITMLISMPESVSTCGNYAIVYFEYDSEVQPGVNTTTKSASAINAKVGSLVNLSTKNKVCVEKVSVAKFEIPNFLEFGPVKVNFELLNQGDIHEAPMGRMVLKDMFNTVVAYQTIKDQRIFPETIKTYTSSVGPKWLIGRFAVELRAKYGKGNTPLVYTAYLWIIPWRLIIIVLLALLIITIVVKNVLGKVEHKEQELESKLEKEEEEISQLKKMLREKKE